MAITLEMFTFDKKLNSTKQPSGSGTSVSAVMKDNTSVLSPHFILKDFNTSWNYIKWGSRYYFVDDIVLLSNSHAEYVCRTDVLATFKTVIGTSSQYVLRAASQYNPYIVDTKYPAKASATLSQTLLSNLAVDSTGIYVVGIISETDSGNAVTYYTLGPSNFGQLMQALFDVSYLNAQDISTELQKELVNPMQYVTSCYWFPFTAQQAAGDLAEIYFGWWDSGVYAGKLSESGRIVSLETTFSLPGHPQVSRGNYLNDAPYTRHTLNCYTFGSIPLDPAPFADGSAGAIQIDVDLYTGIGQMYVACNSSRLFTTVSQFGVPIQLAQSQGNIVSGALSALGGAVGLAYGNVVGFAQGIASAVEAAMPQVQSQGANGSKVAFLQTANIVSQFRQLVPEDNAQIGRPLCDVKTINTLSGYILCEEADLDFAGSASEKEQVISYMNSGFYYE